MPEELLSVIQHKEDEEKAEREWESYFNPESDRDVIDDDIFFLK